MNLNHYTTRAGEAVQRATRLAGKLFHQAVAPLHLLAALLEAEDGIIPPLLRKFEVIPSDLASRVQDLLKKFPRVSGEAGNYIAPELKAVSDRAETEAAGLHDEFISTEHLFLSLLDQPEVKKILPLSREDVLKELGAGKNPPHGTVPALETL